ncbi:fatty acid desaturase [Thalassotalea nanhaiensis]|uniref:Fatty acid desaturase n=1 Tax=Thalassotalea nanhaiensis TaxID=3065648 RepID=A0ABY9TE79_9GAMM|nr:fatty acid desaturase [Colwelliaceae bacterium SQ345]
MNTDTMKGQMPTAAIEDLKELAARAEFKKLLYVPSVNWVLIISCLLSLVAWLYLSNQWLAGNLSAWWLTLLSTYTFFIFILTVHEASHLVLSRNRWLNDILGTLLTVIPYPQLPIVQFRHQHLTHHRDTCGVEDPDDYLYQGNWLTRMFKIFTHDFYWCYWSFSNRDSASKSTTVVNLLSMTIYISVLVLGFTSAYWYEFLMLYVIPQRIGFFVAILMFAYVQHPPEKCSVKERSPFMTTSIIRGFDSPFAKVYFGQNRHLIHHLYPNMPIYRNWQAWQLGKDIFERQNLANIGIDAEKFTQLNNQNQEQHKQNNQNRVAQSSLYVTITAVEQVAQGINSYTFEPSESSQTLPKFEPGAHIDVEVADGIIRQYSLCNDYQQRNCYQIAVQCEENGRGGSELLHETFKVGQVVKISKPRNLFALKPASNVLLFAGGIGITPMLAMAWKLHHQGTPFELHYCFATHNKWAFKDTWKTLPFKDQIKVYIDDNKDIEPLNAEQVLTRDNSANVYVYVCGPEGFMNYIERSAQAAGVTEEQFNKESFAGAEHTDVNLNKEFTLKVTGHEKEFLIPKDKSIIQVLKENDIFVPMSCENGVCGTCKCKIKSGEVEHKDMVLNANEHQVQKLFTPCVTRATTETLEISV